MRAFAVSLLALCLGGCGVVEKITDYSKWQTGTPGEDAAPGATAVPHQAAVAPVVVQPLNPAPGRPRPGEDPAPQPQKVQQLIKAADPVEFIRPQVHLSIYQFTVPAGTIGGDEKFWKRVDESAIDVRTHDILDRNGIRIGLAPFAEMDRLMEIIKKHAPETKPAVYAAAGTKTPIELMMKQQVPYQIIYHYEPDGEMPVRSYDNSANILCLEFEAAPRKPGDVRVGICPMVRSLRKRLVAAQNDEREIEYISPERFFDLTLLTDIPLDGFLVLAPSTESKASMSLGNAFFVSDSEAGRRETVILLIPQAVAVPRGEKVGAELSGAASRPK